MIGRSRYGRDQRVSAHSLTGECIGSDVDQVNQQTLRRVLAWLLEETDQRPDAWEWELAIAIVEARWEALKPWRFCSLTHNPSALCIASAWQEALIGRPARPTIEALDYVDHLSGERTFRGFIEALRWWNGRGENPDRKLLLVLSPVYGDEEALA